MIDFTPSISGKALAHDFFSIAPKYRTKERLAEMAERLLNEAYQEGISNQQPKGDK